MPLYRVNDASSHVPLETCLEIDECDISFRSQKSLVVRLAVLGSSGVGKSAIVVRYLTKRFIGDYESSPVDILYHHTIEVENDTLDIEIRDVSAKESHQEMLLYLREQYLNWADGIVIVYDICDKESFQRAKQILEVICKRKTHNQQPVMLLGNKSDLAHFRKVDRNDADEISLRYGSLFYEISASETPTIITTAFRKFLEQVRLFVLQKNQSKRRKSFLPPVSKLTSIFSIKYSKKRNLTRRKPLTF